MRYLALCTDYDGTLATDGRVLPETLSALERLLASGRRLVLVTGRELDQLKEVCPRLDLFEYGDYGHTIEADELVAMFPEVSRAAETRPPT